MKNHHSQRLFLQNLTIYNSGNLLTWMAIFTAFIFFPKITILYHPFLAFMPAPLFPSAF